MCGTAQAGKTGGKCSFYLSNKGRTCRFDVVPGRDMCGMHLQADVKRVPCPLDPRQCVLRPRSALPLCVCCGQQTC